MKNDDTIPDYLKHWPGLTMRKDDAIVQALPEDIDVARNYPSAKNKGPVISGRRITLLTRKNRYRVSEEVRVIHVMEALEQGHELYVMGPKPIYGESVDGVPVTPTEAPPSIYDGEVRDSPGVDYNYDITSYRFTEPGRHTIDWQFGDLRSNTIELEVEERER